MMSQSVTAFTCFFSGIFNQIPPSYRTVRSSISSKYSKHICTHFSCLPQHNIVCRGAGKMAAKLHIADAILAMFPINWSYTTSSVAYISSNINISQGFFRSLTEKPYNKNLQNIQEICLMEKKFQQNSIKSYLGVMSDIFGFFDNSRNNNSLHKCNNVVSIF